MPRFTSCPHCRRDLEVPDSLIGQHVRCSHCKHVFVAGAARQAVSCPICKAAMAVDASTCPECGYQRPAPEAPPEEPAANLCPNPACGVVNPPTARLCQRCNTPLPTVVGQLVAGKYRIESQIATGGFGIVYRGADVSDGRAVAIKEMIAADPQEFGIRKAFFQREAVILEFLQPAAIVPRLYEYVDGPDYAFLVMEYIAGRNLLEVLEQPGQRPFPVATVAHWGAAICEVLERMHARQPPVVHRDLKPDNLMLLPGEQSIRMIDFGTARAMGKPGRDRNVARTKVFTEGYAPPEQVVGKVEPRSDLFALAGTLYHLVSGRPPEGTFTAREISARLETRDGYPAEDRWFYELLAINLSGSLADRYLSARAFRADLEMQSLTRQVACPRCAAASPAREPYCNACAAPLTDAPEFCPACHAQSALGCRFCTACGARIHA